MRSFHVFRGVLTLGALLMSAAWLPAATVEVNQTSGPHMDVQSAIDAASPGDTILITDSATYTTGTLRWTKQLTIMAAGGENPTLIDNRNDEDGGQFFSIDSADAAAVAGSQLGSNAGGRINVLFDTTATSHEGGTRNYLFPRFTGSWDDLTTFTIENIFMTQLKDPGDDNSFRIHLWRDDGGATRTVNIDNVEVDAGAYPGGGDGLLRLNNPFVYCNVNDSYFHNFDGNWAFYTRQGTTLTVNNTAVDARNSGTQILVCFTDVVRRNTLNFDNSLLIGGSGGVFERSSSGGNWNLNDSAFLTFGDSVLEDNDSAQFDVVVADHCDFIVINDDDGNDAVIDLNAPLGERDVDIRNSNVILYADPTTGTTPALDIFTGPNDTIVLDHNNVYVGDWDGGGYDGDLSPTNSIAEDPIYFNAQVGDVRYHNMTVKTGDDSGGPIGNDEAFTPLVPVEMSVFELQ